MRKMKIKRSLLKFLLWLFGIGIEHINEWFEKNEKAA